MCLREFLQYEAASYEANRHGCPALSMRLAKKVRKVIITAPYGGGKIYLTGAIA